MGSGAWGVSARLDAWMQDRMPDGVPVLKSSVRWNAGEDAAKRCQMEGPDLLHRFAPCGIYAVGPYHKESVFYTLKSFSNLSSWSIFKLITLQKSQTDQLPRVFLNSLVSEGKTFKLHEFDECICFRGDQFKIVSSCFDLFI